MNEARKLPHAAERAAERYGVGLSVDDLQAMAEIIRAGKSTRLSDRRNGMEQHLVLLKGRAFRVVSAPNTGRVITVLDPIGKPRSKHLYKQR